MESDDSEVFGAADSLASEFEDDDDDDDGDEWEDGGGADEILAQARRAEAAAHRAAREGLMERHMAMVEVQRQYEANIPPRVRRMVGHLEAPAPPPMPPPAKPTRKEDLHFLRDLIESVQEARPDVVSEGSYLRSSNLLRDLFREAEATEVRYEQRTGRPLRDASRPVSSLLVFATSSETAESMRRFIEQQEDRFIEQPLHPPPRRNTLEPPDHPNDVD